MFSVECSMFAFAAGQRAALFQSTRHSCGHLACPTELHDLSIFAHWPHYPVWSNSESSGNTQIGGLIHGAVSGISRLSRVKQTSGCGIDGTGIYLQMKQAKDINLKQRAAAKMVSRQADRQRLENGESPVVIQRDNSIFPPDYFKHHRILNFASAIGK